jgi:hypothetical protein
MMITLFRKGPGGSLQYYTIHDQQPDLSARFSLSTVWRTGSGKGREKHYVFETLSDMDHKIRELFGRRLRAGYRLLYSFSRKNGIPGIQNASPGEVSAVVSTTNTRKQKRKSG